jgi:hypothetical protein
MEEYSAVRGLCGLKSCSGKILLGLNSKSKVVRFELNRQEKEDVI